MLWRVRLTRVLALVAVCLWGQEACLAGTKSPFKVVDKDAIYFGSGQPKSPATITADD